MITIIAGSRSITDIKQLEEAIIASNFVISEIVSGGAKGVDTMGEEISHILDLPLTVFPADWDKYGRKAGFIRNLQMAEYAEALIAVWDGYSSGTKHMIETAKQRNLKVFIYMANLNA